MVADSQEEAVILLNMDPSRIFAHRGLWENPHEKNSLSSLRNALVNGFSVETDIRSFGTKTVISHDPTDTPPCFLSDLLSLCKNLALTTNQKVALNVKSDGLYLDSIIKFATEPTFFYFDMSVPEKIKYLDHNLPVANRISQFEQTDLVFGEINWVDCLNSTQFYYNLDYDKLKASSSQFIFVSPELHGENPRDFWVFFKEVLLGFPNFAICTDHVMGLLEFMERKS